ncbi:MAG: phytoene desaturase [Proteobacteria bacterium]|nr:phytoene desaturase [Candidatus Fonsibacter lacus]
MNKEAIVIGSGLGGIASAIRLKAKNYDVTLIEKNSDLGGRARTFYKNGYTFDAGPTVITAPYLIEELFLLFKKNINDYIKIAPLKTWYQFVFSDLSKFNYTDDHKKNLSEISKFNSSDIVGFEKLLKFSEKIFNKGYAELANKPFSNFFFMLKQIPSLLLLKSYLSVYKFVSKFIKDEKLKKVFSVHPLLVGGNPFSTTSIYTLILFLEKKWGVHYALGGTGKIVSGLEKLMNEIGIKIIKNDEVVKILTDKKEICGVVTKNNKIINAKTVVCNADPPFVYKYLLDQKQNNFFFKKKMKRMNYSMGLFVYYFGSKKKYNEIQHHTIYFGDTYKDLLNKIFDKKILTDDISYYLHRPTATDPTMAPEDKDCFYVLVPVPNNLSKINWNIEAERFKKIIIEKLSSTLLPNIKEYIENDFYITPDYFEKELRTLHGSGFSIQPLFSQSAYFRFHNKSEIFNGLYFVGAGTHPGAGIPGVLSSAKIIDKIVPQI